MNSIIAHFRNVSAAWRNIYKLTDPSWRTGCHVVL